MNLTILSAAYHRNGCGGMGFFAILFDDAEHGRMIASLFERSESLDTEVLFGEVICSVFSVAELAAGNIAFGYGNSWRGDVYAEALRPLLRRYIAARGTAMYSEPSETQRTDISA